MAPVHWSWTLASDVYLPYLWWPTDRLNLRHQQTTLWELSQRLSGQTISGHWSEGAQSPGGTEGVGYSEQLVVAETLRKQVL